VQLSLYKRTFTLITCEKFIKVLFGINFSMGISFIPNMRQHGCSSSNLWTILAPTFSYSASENILFLDDCTRKSMFGLFSIISFTWVGVKGTLLSHTLLSSVRIPTIYL
jgi:hypothetical protein